MAGSESRRKKLRDDRLELLRWRVAAKLGFASVAKWEDATTPDERASMIALALLDGWGEEWQEIAARIVNQMHLQAAGKLDAENYTSSHDMRRRFAWIDEPDDKPAEIDWNAAAANMAKAFAGVTIG